MKNKINHLILYSIILIFMIIKPITIKAIEVDPNSNYNQNDIVGEVYKQKNIIETYSFEENVYEREEFNLKSKSFDDVDELELKTDSNFEIAIAHEDGSYSYLDSADTMEEALEKIDEAEANSNSKARSIDLSDENNVPVILNENGRVVYSNRSMGRILKHIDGDIYKKFDINTNLYSDSSLKSAFTYINQGYVDDVPIIEDNGKSAKIMVNGYVGWINRDVTSNEYDMIIVPINQVKNPSYYKSENGFLKHYISSNLKATIEEDNGDTITIGVAPSYMKEGVKYLSYDGNFFYDGSNLENALNNLVGDLQSGSYSNAINSDNPYYNYYNYLPFRSKTSYSAQELELFITENTASNSKLRGISTALIDGESKYGVNALLSLGIAINESGWGLSSISQTKNNIFGINAVDSDPGQAAGQFSSPSQCVEEFMKNQISRAYSDPSNFAYYGGFLGKKNYGANVKYASDPFWGEKASQYSFEVDYYLSGKNINNLRDFNKEQIGLYIGSTPVKAYNGSLLYEVTDNLRNYGGYVGTTAVITANLGDKYEINPEIDSPLYNGDILVKYNGLYNFNNKAYVDSTAIKLINDKSNIIKVTYKTHIQDYGWQDWVSNGEVSGTSGESKRLEGIEIDLKNSRYGGSIEYKTHVQDYGWQDWVSNGKISGTSGESKRLEAIEIRLTGEISEKYDIYYRVHAQDFGWLGWTKNGEASGTEGLSKRLEAIEIILVEKDGEAPESTENPFIKEKSSVKYKTHVQNYGWQNWVSDGQMSGTSGEALRLEALEINLDSNLSNRNIEYKTHVQDYGWQDWVSNGKISGTSGESKRLEAIEIRLTGEISEKYDIYYRVHAQDFGWLGWTKNGEASGTEGLSKRLEALEIVLVKKGSQAPGNTENSFIKS